MVCGEELVSRRERRKSATAFSTMALAFMFCGIIPLLPALKIHSPPRTRRHTEENLSCLGPGMVLLIHVLQPVECQVRVDLGGRDIRMTEYGLHRAQVRAVLDHMRGATMAQHVWAGFTSHAHRSGADHLPDALTREPVRAASQE